MLEKAKTNPSARDLFFDISHMKIDMNDPKILMKFVSIMAEKKEKPELPAPSAYPALGEQVMEGSL